MLRPSGRVVFFGLCCR